MATLTEQLTDASGVNVGAGRVVRVRAVADPAAFITADGDALLFESSATTDATGTWSMTVPLSTEVTPSGALLRVQVGTQVRWCTLPDTAGTYTVLDLLTDAPASPSPSDLSTVLGTYSTTAQANAAYVGLTGNQTIAGAKTFSTDPTLADGSSALSLTEGNAAYAQVANNLSDVASATTSRVNLEVQSEFDTDPYGYPIVARAFVSAATQSIPNDTYTPITLNGVGFDTHGVLDAAQPTKIFLNRRGFWRVSTSVVFATSATGRRELLVRFNGATQLRAQSSTPSASSSLNLYVGGVIESTAPGDYITVEAYQNTGGAHNIQGLSTNSYASVEFIGKQAAQPVVLFGDSITVAGSTATGWYTVANGSKPQSRLRLVSNAGIGGNGTAAMLARVTADVINKVPKPYVATVMGGTNDMAVLTSAQIIANLEDIYDALEAADIRIIACTITPRTDLNSTLGADLVAVNAWIRANYSNYTNAILCDWNPTLTTDGLPGYQANAAYLSDTVHPNATGHDRMADVLEPLLAGIPRP